jgi:hypothetical protein
MANSQSTVGTKWIMAQLLDMKLWLRWRPCGVCLVLSQLQPVVILNTYSHRPNIKIFLTIQFIMIRKQIIQI